MYNFHILCDCTLITRRNFVIHPGKTFQILKYCHLNRNIHYTGIYNFHEHEIIALRIHAIPLHCWLFVTTLKWHWNNTICWNLFQRSQKWNPELPILSSSINATNIIACYDNLTGSQYLWSCCKYSIVPLDCQ
jgi:hypothetical protein